MFKFEAFISRLVDLCLPDDTCLRRGVVVVHPFADVTARSRICVAARGAVDDHGPCSMIIAHRTCLPSGGASSCFLSSSSPSCRSNGSGGVLSLRVWKWIYRKDCGSENLVQVVHIALLSRLEARKSRGAASGGSGDASLAQRDAFEDRTQMLAAIRRSAVLDSSGEFHIVNFLARADSLLGSRNHVRPDVTLVTQSTPNHLHYLVALSERWRGPLAVTVFAPRSQLSLVVEVLVQLRRCVPALRYNASFHLVYPLKSPGLHQPPDTGSNLLSDDNASSGGGTNSVDGSAPSSSSPLAAMSCDSVAARLQRSVPGPENYDLGVSYPVNLLRNVARRNALTEFVIVLDVDLLPNDGLHGQFVAFARENRLFVDSHRDDKTVYVAPAFEVREGVPSPRDKASLLQRVEAMDARPFYLELCWKCQKHTDYEAWQREPPGDKLAVLFEVLWRDPWEPFYFGRNSAPFYDERFRQYGFNRISQSGIHVAGDGGDFISGTKVVGNGLAVSSVLKLADVAEA
ncbi:hypothetical protein HPB50_003295 [Hyalomma asiaticum]|uniref:Uncharacterized protein n=1 Tax=Hyalomma asiaticum TaxID=266040 RepID=A0ACB7RSW4_HYAAI|nr:hypothetical protein HPB50_003295 [Hyalomma asiaticum]